MKQLACMLPGAAGYLAVSHKGAEDRLPVLARQGLVASILGEALLALGPAAGGSQACLPQLLPA